MTLRPLPLKAVAIAGIVLLMIGFLLFLNSLGGGGGMYSLSIMVAGATAILTSIGIAVARAVRR